MLLGGKDNSEPARCRAGEGLAAAQHHLVSEETPPQRQLLLKRWLAQILPRQFKRNRLCGLYRPCNKSELLKLTLDQLPFWGQPRHTAQQACPGRGSPFCAALWSSSCEHPSACVCSPLKIHCRSTLQHQNVKLHQVNVMFLGFFHYYLSIFMLSRTQEEAQEGRRKFLARRKITGE